MTLSLQGVQLSARHGQAGCGTAIAPVAVKVCCELSCMVVVPLCLRCRPWIQLPYVIDVAAATHRWETVRYRTWATSALFLLYQAVISISSYWVWLRAIHAEFTTAYLRVQSAECTTRIVIQVFENSSQSERSYPVPRPPMPL
ncbi:hypothetical protein GY45DRAFT_779593 [Cubamyces sp. BRFM 1775]|nr:hypothetical protein GY45DRAFT_779593 [Cubamyces sp. BRFM 1775]